MAIVNTCIYYIVHGNYGSTSFIIKHTFLAALRVHCVWFTLSYTLSSKIHRI